MTRPRIDTDELRKLLAEATPGKWVAKWSKYEKGTFIVQTNHSSNRVLSVFDGDGYGVDEQSLSDARLIALAPELADELIRMRAHAEAMAEALGRMVVVYSDMETGDGEPCPVVASARSALTAYRASTKETTDGK